MSQKRLARKKNKEQKMAALVNLSTDKRRAAPAENTDTLSEHEKVCNYKCCKHFGGSVIQSSS